MPHASSRPRRERWPPPFIPRPGHMRARQTGPPLSDAYLPLPASLPRRQKLPLTAADSGARASCLPASTIVRPGGRKKWPRARPLHPNGHIPDVSRLAAGAASSDFSRLRPAQKLQPGVGGMPVRPVPALVGTLFPLFLSAGGSRLSTPCISGSFFRPFARILPVRGRLPFCPVFAVSARCALFQPFPRPRSMDRDDPARGTLFPPVGARIPPRQRAMPRMPAAFLPQEKDLPATSTARRT